MNNDDWEKLKNFTIFKVYATDREMEDMMPVFGIIVLILIVIGGLYWLLT